MVGQENERERVIVEKRMMATMMEGSMTEDGMTMADGTVIVKKTIKAAMMDGMTMATMAD